MENWERSKFEEEWKDALEGAEVAPSKAVWSGIDQELTRAEGNSMKRTVIFYQRLAAACVLFALVAGTFGVYHWSENKQQRLAKKEETNFDLKSSDDKKISADKQTKNIASAGTIKNKIDGEEALKKLESENNSGGTVKSNAEKGIDSKKLNKENANNLPLREKQTFNENNGGPNKLALSQRDGSTSETKIASKNPDKKIKNDFQSRENQTGFKKNVDGSDHVVSVQTENVKIPVLEGKKNHDENTETYVASVNLNLDDLKALPEVALKGKPVYVEIIRQLPAISPLFMNAYRDEKINHEKLWASVTAAAGTFSNYNGGSSYLAYNSSTSSPSGNAYTAGFLGGVRIAKRWVLQSGFQYMDQSADYTTNISATSLNAVSKYAVNPAAFTVGGSGTSNSFSSTYGIISTNEFFTIPVQAGYLLIDRKIGWQINPGVATDFFVRNTLTDPSGQRQSYSQGAGGDSPYRSINFAGLMSSEVSYKFGKSYRVSLVPGFRYSVNPILKTQNTGNPLVWDVAFRLRYIFK
ncbi:MAG TPA: hypothetical protein DGG95_14220 [Cytophagales bacterium]|nr:hypothetical protein [Cytophagales bacterium]